MFVALTFKTLDMIYEDVLDLEEERPVEYTDASKTKRFINYVIDRIILFVIGVVAYIGFEYIDVIIPDNAITNYLFGSAIGFVYYFIFEISTQRTLGKLVTKTKVVTEDGLTPTSHMLITRSLSRFVPFDAFSYLGSENTGWHDRWSKTRVVEID